MRVHKKKTSITLAATHSMYPGKWGSLSLNLGSVTRLRILPWDKDSLHTNEPLPSPVGNTRQADTTFVGHGEGGG